MNFKDNFVEWRCLFYDEKFQHKLNEKLTKPFFNTNKFSKHNNNKFILLLRKGVYAY